MLARVPLRCCPLLRSCRPPALRTEVGGRVARYSLGRMTLRQREREAHSEREEREMHIPLSLPPSSSLSPPHLLILSLLLCARGVCLSLSYTRCGMCKEPPPTASRCLPSQPLLPHERWGHHPHRWCPPSPLPLSRRSLLAHSGRCTVRVLCRTRPGACSTTRASRQAVQGCRLPSRSSIRRLTWGKSD